MGVECMCGSWNSAQGLSYYASPALGTILPPLLYFLLFIGDIMSLSYPGWPWTHSCSSKSLWIFHPPASASQVCEKTVLHHHAHIHFMDIWILRERRIPEKSNTWINSSWLKSFLETKVWLFQSTQCGHLSCFHFLFEWTGRLSSATSLIPETRRCTVVYGVTLC